MIIKFYNVGTINEDDLQIAIIVSRYKDKWIFVRHEDRETFEFPAGHREKNETIYDAARRELYEETGAVDYEIRDLYDYCVEKENKEGYGRIFLAEINKLDELPNYEIEERIFTKDIPGKLTYAEVQREVFYKVKKEFKRI